MKKIILLAAGLFVFATATQAQETTEKTASTATNVKQEKLTPEQRAQKHVDEIDKVTALTAEQKVKVKELALAKITRMQDIRVKYKDQAELAQKEQREVKKNFQEGLKSVLTAEQQEKLKGMERERKAQKRAASQH